ncbi:chitobiase/beta-hexosaminidase C-terminal domain protein [Leptospira ellinghausenii]|uniref:Chitobiase/beta-hexosaminidase C-terminal domain protein n=1 Tax=Leptospira ellinghausenii TaxID=1917822 RepID=A0A2P2DF79_9LEPT|nr:chitobiase/beta-hexosaminidase C-terminal domain-containing protein [Leptospira ellinghausenii]GBF43304.1 chitobiase/beta-hexosaminidase C-terminal domain protein [Leptospira ellinghausenii]
MKRKILTVLLLGLSLYHCNGFLLPKDKQNQSSFLASFLGLFIGNPDTSRSVSAEVGPNGGTLQASDGSFSFEIPAGALAETKVITISRNVNPNGSIPTEYNSTSPVFKFEPEGLKFLKPAYLNINYDQGRLPEAGIEERSIGMYYVKDDSTLEKMKKVSVDYSSNTIKVEVVHFSFGVGLNIQIWLVSSGIITNPNPVSNIANKVIEELANYADYGYASVSEYYQANAGILGPFINQIVAVLGTDPITAAFPTADFDGDGAPNFEDPMVPSLGPVITVNSISAPNVSTLSGSILSTEIQWKSSKTGTYSIRKNAADCNSGTVLYSGNVTANVNQTSGSILASSLNLGTNALRICVTSSGVTGFGVASVNRDDTVPGVTIFPSGGNYGTVQSVVLNCSDVGGAGCSKVIYTTNGTTPSFGANCSVNAGSVYTTSIPTPNQTTTTFKVRTCDQAGNQSIVYSETYTVDTVVPTITINSVLPSTHLKSGQIATISWKSDKEGNYILKQGTSCAAGTPLVGTNVSGTVAANESVTSEIPVASLGAEGNKTVLVCVANLIGTNGSSSVSYIVDFASPVITSSVANGTYSAPQTLTITCDDVPSGCHEIIYTVNGSSPSFDSSGAILNGQLYTGSIITPNNTVLEYRFLAKDHAGNVSAELVRNFTIGELIPKFTSFEVPGAAISTTINETAKTITILVNKTNTPEYNVTYTVENASSVVLTNSLPSQIPFQQNDSIPVIWDYSRKLVKELTLMSPTGNSVNYKIFTIGFDVRIHTPPASNLSTKTSANIQINGWFSENVKFRIESIHGNVDLTQCVRMPYGEEIQYHICHNIPLFPNPNGYYLDFVVTDVAPYKSYKVQKATKLIGTKNGVGFENGEIPYCILHYPTSMNVQVGPTATESNWIYSRVYYPNVTNNLIDNTLITGEIGYGPQGTDPRTNESWLYFPMTFNPTTFIDNTNNSEYAGKFKFQPYTSVSTHSYVARFSIDGGLNYTYCDTNGNGSDYFTYGQIYPELQFSPTLLGTLNLTQ